MLPSHLKIIFKTVKGASITWSHKHWILNSILIHFKHTYKSHHQILISYYTCIELTMKCHSRLLVAFLLALILILLHSGPNTAEAARFVFSSSTSQTLKVHEHGRISEKQPLKKVKSSFRRIPRSRSNPTQNK